MNDQPTLNYKLPWKIALIAAVSLPVFIVGGMLLDYLYNPPRSNSAFNPVVIVISLVAVPVYYFVFRSWSFRIEKYYNIKKINWPRWDKSGESLFVLYRITLGTIGAFIFAVIVAAFEAYVLKEKASIFIVTLLTSTGFAYSLVYGIGLWQVHQLYKNYPGAHGS